jgi:hypothetical protein
MKNLADFGRVFERDDRELKQRLDGLIGRQALMIDDCALLPGCTPDRATVSMYQTMLFYAIRLDRSVSYFGQNRAMAALSNGEPVYFRTFHLLRDFFRELASEAVPAPVPAPMPAPTPSLPPQTNEYDLSTIVDTSALTAPPDTARASLDYKAIQRELEKSVMGQKTAVETIAYQVALHLKKTNPKKPLSFVAYGPPGTGKSETAKLLARTLSKLSPHKYENVWTDLNQFADKHSVYRLIGAPPSYVGYDDSPIFEAATRNPYSVFIFDELDKAHPEVLKVFMAILDEGRCAAQKEAADNSREYDFKHCIFIFTSNHRLGKLGQKTIGFSLADDVKDIRRENDAVDVSYTENSPEDESAELTKRIYGNTEAARKAFMTAGVLREIASRFNCFVEFAELSDEAKIQILAKQVVETGFEYDIRLAHISPDIMQGLIDASASAKALTVRSFKAVIEGYLASAFADAGASFPGRAVRLEGEIKAPVITPV